MTQYVYLFHTREFFNSNQPIYKIGKTTKPNFTRFSNYPKGSVMLFQSACLNCHELNTFKKPTLDGSILRVINVV